MDAMGHIDAHGHDLPYVKQQEPVTASSIAGFQIGTLGLIGMAIVGYYLLFRQDTLFS